MKNYQISFVFIATLCSLINPETAKAAPKSLIPVRTQQVQNWNTASSDPMSQITSVSELRDVAPTDWAFEALRSLVERYGCIVGYPDRTFKGNKALSRWEFAAGLNACLNTMERLIQEGGISKDDINKLKRLVEEFRGELAALGAKIDNLEGRVSFLENHQFSTTTKLNGEVIFSISGATGGEPGNKGSQIVFNDRVRLNLVTSFTGKDTLITGLQAYNFTGGTSVLFPKNGSPLSEGMTKLNYEPQFPGLNPQNLTRACGNNSVCIYKLLYLTPVADNFTLFIAPMVEVSDAFPAIIPFSSEGQGAISRYAALNPVLRVSGGTSEAGLATAAGFIFTPIPSVDWRALYASVNASLPQNQGFPGTPLGAGLFNGSYVASTQLTLKPSSDLDIGLNYAHSYHQINITGLGLSSSSTGVLGGLPLDTPVSVDSLGASLTWRITPEVHFTTYGSYFMVNQAGQGSAYSNLTSWMAGLYFPDAFVKGNSAGILGGQPLYTTAAGNGANLNAGVVNHTIPYQIEAFYNFRVTNNISITPGAFVIFNPESDSANSTTGVFVLRTTFTF